MNTATAIVGCLRIGSLYAGAFEDAMRRSDAALGDAKLRQRIVWVALTGVIPLFVVALMLIQAVYTTPIEFARREQSGLALAHRIEDALVSVYEYRSLRAAAESRSARERAQRALALLGASHQGAARELGLGSLPSIDDPDAPKLVLRLLDAMQQVGDGSNLILDHDLDSYYLVDMVLILPQVEQRLFRAQLESEAWWGSGEKSERLATLVALAQDSDLSRLQRDARRSLEEDARFNGASPTLQARLPPALDRYASSVQRLADIATRAKRDAAVPKADLEAAALAARTASSELFRAAAGELERLLTRRVEAIEGQRARAFLLIVGTLLGAAAVIVLLIRGLLAARYREMLAVQDELRAKEAQLRALSDNLPGGMTYQVLREPSGKMRFLYVSAGVEALHGVTASEVLADAKALYDLLLPEDLPALQAAEQESLEHQTPFRLVARSRRRSDGVVRWLEFASAPRKLPSGGVVWDGIQLDVTERQRVEDAVRQSEQRFARIFDDSPIPISLTRMSDGKFVAVNDSFLAFSGFSREEALGRTASELGLYAEPSQREALLQRLERDGYVHAHEVSVRVKSGAIRDDLLWIEVLTIDSEKFILAMSLDMTEQKAANRQQKELEEQLRQAQKLDALGTLAGGIAHDFNNILGAIIAYAELSRLDNPDNALLAENLNEVLQASQRATVLVRQILSFSRQQKEERSAQPLAPIVKEALSLLRATLPATIELESSLDARVGDVLVNATQVHQIVMNLCTNAAHAMKGKTGKLGVTLSAERVESGTSLAHVGLASGDYVRLEISDTGHGMDAATVQRIFDPFFTTKPAGEGTGLGLSVVHGIVKEYGGVVTVDSTPGRGTTFRIFLPATRASAKASVASDEVPRGHGERVLFVDDEAQLGTAAGKMLQRLGYQPDVHRSPGAALAGLEREASAYSVLVTDFTMPEMTGLELIQSARSIRPDIAVILVSGSVTPLAEAALAELGQVKLLSKPLGYAELAGALRQVLHTGR